ncbi:MAG: methyltransferase domain-containing protein [Actinobacteria bacterium]|nr:methyltransferase domain-containing protein [Actinomycetota bacterium]
MHTSDLDSRRMIQDFLSNVYGDPFDDVLRRAEAHRESHGTACGLFPAGPHVMRLAATVARACRARRMLDLGTGIGYSALWLASAVDGATVEAIDRFAEHVTIGKEVVEAAGLSGRISFIHGEVADVLNDLHGPYDLIHDDAWFAWEPPYLERVVQLLSPGGVLTIPNWFLLEDAIVGEPRKDWAEFAGPKWAEGVIAYARRLGTHPHFYVTWSIEPPLAVAVKREPS